MADVSLFLVSILLRADLRQRRETKAKSSKVVVSSNFLTKSARLWCRRQKITFVYYAVLEQDCLDLLDYLLVSGYERSSIHSII